MARSYGELFTVTVIESGLRNLFAWQGKGGLVHASNHLSSNSDLSVGLCRLTVTSEAGEEKAIWYHQEHDYSSRFTPEEYNFLAEGACKALHAGDLTPGDKVTVAWDSQSLEKRSKLDQVILATVVWFSMTHYHGSAHFVDPRKVRQLLR